MTGGSPGPPVLLDYAAPGRRRVALRPVPLVLVSIGVAAVALAGWLLRTLRPADTVGLACVPVLAAVGALWVVGGLHGMIVGRPRH